MPGHNKNIAVSKRFVIGSGNIYFSYLTQILRKIKCFYYIIEYKIHKVINKILNMHSNIHK